MKQFKILYIVAAFFMAASVSAQQLRTAYFMDKATVRTALNPALRPARGYVSIPGIGGLNVSYGSNSLSLDRVLYPTNNGLVTFLDPSVSSKDFLGNLKSNNYMDTDVAMSLISFGFFTGQSFWSFDLSLKNNANFGLPKGIFEFAKNGSGLNGKVYDIKELQVNAESYVEAGLGYSRPINDKLTVGGKFKFLIGAANAKMYFKHMYISANENAWEISGEGQLDISMAGLEPGYEFNEDDQREYIDLSEFDMGTPGIGGFGVGVDLGATYQLLDNLNLSAAIIDLGFIKWSKKNTVSAMSKGNVNFKGFDFAVNEDSDVPSMDDQTEDLGDQFSEFTNFEQVDSRSRATSLRTTVNLGAEYTMFSNTLGFGLLSSTRFGRPRVFSELTASVNYRPINWFSATASYSFVRSDFKTFGFALNFSPCWINFFLGTDYMLTSVTPQYVPLKQRGMNMYFGLSIPLAKMGSN